MVHEHKLSWILMIIVLLQTKFPLPVAAEPLVPCYFIFGDSLIDSGNNNLLRTVVKANFWPNGIDFPSGSTGRFCNGRTTSDITGGLLGFDEFIPPYATANGKQILRGVNYASAASGIRDETGNYLGERVSFSQQIENFKMTVSQIGEMLGSLNIAAGHLRRCIYYIGIGNNDYLNNYFLPFYATGLIYTPEQYAYVLVDQYSKKLETLYDYGARKIAIVGLGPMGYQPYHLARSSPDGKTPIEIYNRVIQIFNDRLKNLTEDLNSKYNDANFIYLNAYDIALDILSNPAAYGFNVINSACCGLGRNNAERSCPHDTIPCKNRSDHFFWDSFHPTEAANIFISKRFFRAQKPSDSYPFDIHRLALI